MTTLLLAEHDNVRLDPATARAVTAAAALGAPVHVLVAGQACDAVAEAATQLAGVAKVLQVEADHYAHHLAEPLAALIARLAEGYDALLAPATANGKAVLPRVAALLDLPQISEVAAITAPGTFEQAIYAGSVLRTVRSTAAKHILTIRTSAFAPAAAQAAAPIERIAAADDPKLSTCVTLLTSAPDGRPDLASAKIVVGGGRGLGSRQGFALLQALAGRLDAAIGASRAAVDAGLATNDLQIGQGGRTIAPEIYIAVGISGAIQHLCGVRDAGIIAAINKDPEAPIFAVADIGLVGDLFAVLPALEAALAKRSQ
jgi:electron transfer flavoprotein alpha subunit